MPLKKRQTVEGRHLPGSRPCAAAQGLIIWWGPERGHPWWGGQARKNATAKNGSSSTGSPGHQENLSCSSLIHAAFFFSCGVPASCASLSAWRYCKLKYSRCDLHYGFQTLNTRDQRGIYNLPVFPRFVSKASSLSASLPLCPCTYLSCGDPRAVRIVPIWSARSCMIPRGSRSCPRTLIVLSANIFIHGRGIDAPPTIFRRSTRKVCENGHFCFRTLPDLVRNLVDAPLNS